MYSQVPYVRSSAQDNATEQICTLYTLTNPAHTTIYQQLWRKVSMLASTMGTDSQHTAPALFSYSALAFFLNSGYSIKIDTASAALTLVL